MNRLFIVIEEFFNHKYFTKIYEKLRIGNTERVITRGFSNIKKVINVSSERRFRGSDFTANSQLWELARWNVVNGPQGSPFVP